MVVLDVGSEKVVGEIRGTPAVHGVALATDVKRGFTTNGGNDTVTMFDLEKVEPLGRIPVAAGPDAILYDPFSRRVFAFGRKAEEATAIDPALGTAVGSVALGGRPVAAIVRWKGSGLREPPEQGRDRVLRPCDARHRESLAPRAL